MQGFEKIIELMITVVLLFLVPLQYTGAKADVVNRTYIMTETAYFVDAVRNTGQMTEQMYKEYLKKLTVSQQVYDIELTHYKKLLNETEEGFETYYHGVYTKEILEELFSEGGSYELLPGDFFCIRVNRRGISFAERFSLFLKKDTKETASYTEIIYGGRVRNEAS